MSFCALDCVLYILAIDLIFNTFSQQQTIEMTPAVSQWFTLMGPSSDYFAVGWMWKVIAFHGGVEIAQADYFILGWNLGSRIKYEALTF